MKDWTGNQNSIFKILGASNHTEKERQTEDYYATDPVAIDKLKAVFYLPKHLWECACGEGHLASRLEQLGHEVYSTDIVNRGYEKQTQNLDFLDLISTQKFIEDKPDFTSIITNPPYKFATEFIENALHILHSGAYAIFLLKTTALEGKGRYEKIYKNYPPRYLFQFTERLLCAKNGNFQQMKSGGGSAVAYAWFVWQKDNYKPTTIMWI